MPVDDQHQELAGRFDIRSWMAQHNVSLPVSEPALRSDIAKLLRRDLTERLAASGAQARPNPDRTVRRNADGGQSADSATA
jgi:hypothetical protein